MLTNVRDKPNYSEFYDPRLVAIYDTINPIDEYKTFYVDLATQFSALSIIDIGCGSGLLTHALSEQGYDMIGVEPSREMLNLAKQRNYDKPVLWIEGDALKLGEVQADLAIMTGHVAQFYLEDEYWRKALATIHKALKPGGHIAFESRNPLVSPFAAWPTEKAHGRPIDTKAGKVEWWYESLTANGNQIHYNIHYLFIKSGEELVSENELVFRSRAEIEQSLEAAGFLVENVYGDWNKIPASKQSPELIFVAERD